MKPSKKIEAEVLKVYETWLNSYLNGDVQTYDKYLDDEYHFIGSTNNEEFLSRKATTQFFADTADQLAGKCDLRNESRTIEKFGELVFITHVFDAWFLNENAWSYYGRFRFTNALRKNEEGWRFIYQHFSTPDSNTEEGETIGFEKINEENKELREAITRRTFELEQKNRELEVEAALERVRSVAMSMQEPTELSLISESLFTQLKSLGFTDLRNSEIIINNDSKESITSYYYSDYGVTGIIEIDYQSNPILKEWATQIRKTDDAFAQVIIAENKIAEWRKYRLSLGYLADSKLEQATSIYYYSYSIGLGALSISSFTPVSDEQIQILKRFRNVFDLAYKRYTDIALAEAQAREAQIEAAIEKVRSKTMAMQHSDEIRTLIAAVFEQLKELGYHPAATSMAIYNDDLSSEHWFAGFSHEILPKSYHVPYCQHPYYQAEVKGWQDQLPHDVLLFEGEDKVSFIQWLLENSEYENLPEDFKQEMKNLKAAYITNAYMKYGFMEIVSEEPVPPESISILERFAQVFEQSYTRFHDLKKAEAQAREAQIETALERVRSRTMGMHNSDELSEVASLLFQQLTQLNLMPNSCALSIFNQDSTTMELYFSVEGKVFPNSLTVPHSLNQNLANTYKAWKKGESLQFHDLEGNELRKHNESVINYMKSIDVTLPVETQTDQIVGQRRLDYHAFFSDGLLLFSYNQPIKETNIFVRFAKVFEQTYTRFNDLQKAEAQAREAQIEGALERVRAQTMAMHRSDELSKVAEAMFVEYNALGLIEGLTRAVIVTIDEDSADCEVWMTTLEGELGTYFKYNALVNKEWEEEFHAFKKIKKDKRKEHRYSIEFEEESLEQLLSFASEMDIMTADEFRAFSDTGINKWVENSVFYAYGTLNIQKQSALTDEGFAILHRFAAVFEQSYTRFLDLQKAEAQAREAQIEASLERARAQSMMMQQSDELHQTSAVFHDQLRLLGIDSEFSYLWLPNEENEEHMFWATWQDETELSLGFKNKRVVYPLDKKEPSIAECYVAWESGNNPHVNRVLPKDVGAYFATWPELLDGVEKFKPELFPEGLYYVDAYMKYGCFGIMIRRLLSEAENQILSRFSKEFERAYTRFLDLQKAEAQAREAQIEASLEKVRGIGMGMQRSEELHDILPVVFQQYDVLSIKPVTVFLTLMDLPNDQFLYRASGKGGERSYGEQIVDISATNIWDETLERFRNQESYSVEVIHYPKESLPSLIEIFRETIATVSDENQMRVADFPDGLYAVHGKFENGYLGFNHHRPVTEEEKDISSRFAVEFGRLYTRFLDLQKAEAQGREAQIEAALEKVRSRSLAMHKSDELNEIVVVLFEKLKDLQIPVTAFGIALKIDGSKDLNGFVCGENEDGLVITNYRLPYFKNKISIDLSNALEKQLDFFVGHYSKEEKNAFYKYLIKHTAELKALPEDIKRMIFDSPSYTISMVAVKNAMFNINDFEGKELSSNHVNIIKRFAKVFDQAYTRFLDLEKAEAQAREAQIELALERVRASAMAMRISDDLIQCTTVVFEELEKLDLTMQRSGIGVFDRETRDCDLWTCAVNSQGEIELATGITSMTIHPMLTTTWDAWLDQTPVSYTLEGQDLINYYNIISEGNFYLSDEVISNSSALPKEYYYYTPFVAGGLYFFSDTEPLQADKDILGRFAEVFHMTYTRFLDLQKAEAQAELARKQNEEIEKAYKNLQATQTQLIQAEKMASLGELTAGIAHEIQNPLNFVNNFSDVSVELIDEAVGELTSTPLSEQNLDEAKDILNDLKNNLEKIAHHGGRASGIVKGMLDHSRTSSGEKIPTDINALADEYLRLSYHGLRAKDKSFNCTLETHFDPKLEKIQVIPQDIGRVFLNIYNNAFYACSARGARTGADRSVSTEGLGVGGANEDDASKANTQPTDASVSTGLTSKENPTREEFKPLITVSTQQLNNQAIITISDNGIGMSKATLEKVFQPFFTTKPTGSGTGLGMSISYDIITKGHGGEMTVESKEGEGTTFIIQLPSNKNA